MRRLGDPGSPPVPAKPETTFRVVTPPAATPNAEADDDGDENGRDEEERRARRMLRQLGVGPAAALPGAPLFIDNPLRDASVTLGVAVAAWRHVVGVTAARHTGPVDRIHLKVMKVFCP